MKVLHVVLSEHPELKKHTRLIRLYYQNFSQYNKTNKRFKEKFVSDMLYTSRLLIPCVHIILSINMRK